jgi:hypothetical protein
MENELIFASASARGRDIAELTRALSEQIFDQLAHHPVDLALAFLSPHFARAAVFIADGLRDALHPRVLLGCTAEGVIARDAEIERDAAITLVAAHLPGVHLAPFAFDAEHWDAILSSRLRFDETLIAPRDPKIFLLLADPFSTPTERVLDAFNTHHPGIPVIGGMASGSARSKGNSLLLNERVFIEGAVGVALAGAFDLDVIVSQGCRPIGRAYTVTEARENVIFKLGGEPPLPQIQNLIEQLAPVDRALLNNGLFIGRGARRVGARRFFGARGDGRGSHIGRDCSGRLHSRGRDDSISFARRDDGGRRFGNDVDAANIFRAAARRVIVFVQRTRHANVQSSRRRRFHDSKNFGRRQSRRLFLRRRNRTDRRKKFFARAHREYGVVSISIPGWIVA